MEDFCARLNDLPDEIIMIILKKLYNVEVLYYFIGVNKRLNTIAHDSIFSSCLNLYQYFSDDDYICPLPDLMLNRFCSQILPSIHNKIQWLNLESSSMKRILSATNYPNLYGLGLYDINVEVAPSLFTDESFFNPLFKNQILSLVIDIVENDEQSSSEYMNIFIFTQIFTMFPNLKYLNFGPSSIFYQRLSFGISPPTIISSTLLELHVCLDDFIDCLYLLDGRFNQLHSFHVHILFIFTVDTTINNKEKLSNLKCFSLHCDSTTNSYERSILPLLYRMINLEKLDLHLMILCNQEFVDSYDLKKNIINRIPGLKNFVFNIRSMRYFCNEIRLPLNEDIQHTFNSLQNNKIISYVNYFPEAGYSEYHIYSYPYKLKFYRNITNNFPGGLFKYVTEVSLFDEQPFEHEFFLQIQKSFPFMKELTVINQKPQNKKQYENFKNYDQTLSIIKYPHLTLLNLDCVHDDYIEQFLFDTKMSLSNNLYLIIDYQSLARVTHNFQRNITRINCAKLRYLRLHGEYTILKHVKDYFPYTEIC
ncbi:unnamed protein product [Rotaria sordida]|uniref:F-box domain-containing protein n=1 Tax=Rotaria sordida TaxID=392033 RepID=A0A815P249_9BILA|nr:unnamed protein product [Rotaria sordida]